LSECFKIEPLSPSHDRAAFFSSSEPLDRYLKHQASQDVRKKLTAVFVLTPDGKTIAGYYTLSNFSVVVHDIPESIRNRLTRMPEVPTTLLGRLARSFDFKGQGVGSLLLADALKRALQGSTQVASWAVVVDAKDAEAIEFYRRFGFIALPTNSQRLFLPMGTIEKLFGVSSKK
jgi:ribosomal protein S18 acetylase RimI-like enzyme